MSSEKQSPFITWLENVRDHKDQSYSRSTLAQLRRGLGKEAGEDANVMRHVARWLPVDATPWSERPYYAVAPLFALHPQAGGTGNLGGHFRDLQQGKQNEDALERRFTAMLNAHEEELSWHLRQAVSLCKSNNVPIDWHALFGDIRGWGHPNRWVQRKWSSSFWGRLKEDGQQTEEANE